MEVVDEVLVEELIIEDIFVVDIKNTHVTKNNRGFLAWVCAWLKYLTINWEVHNKVHVLTMSQSLPM